MTSKLYVANSDNTGYIDLTSFTGQKGSPFFDSNGTSLITLGMRCANGEASQGTFKLMDPEADLPSLPFNVPPHKVLFWTEDAPGDEIWLSRGRVATYDGGREMPFEVDNRVGFDVVVDDGNIELRGQAFTEEWVRPSETGVARVVALGAYTLNGAASTATNHRDTCEVTVSTSHLAPNTLTTTMPAKTYPPGTQPQAVIQDCADTENKIYSVVIHHDGGSHLCLLYIANDDHTTYLSPIKISDHLDDWDPTDASDPVYEPHWEMGKASLYDGQQLLTGIVSEWEGQHIFAEHTPTIATYDYWVDSYSDSASVSLAQAQQVVNALINQRRLIRITHRVSIIMEATQLDLVAAGMSLEVRAAAIMGGTFLDEWLTRRVVECQFEPRIDGRYWAHLHLDRVPRRYPDFKGSVKVPVVCGGQTVEGGSELLNFDWQEAPDNEEIIPAIAGLSQPAITLGSTENPAIIPGDYYYAMHDRDDAVYVFTAVDPGDEIVVSLQYSTGQHWSVRDIEPLVLEWVSGSYTGAASGYTTLSVNELELTYSPNVLRSGAISATAPASAVGLRLAKDSAGTTLPFFVHAITLTGGATLTECPPGSAAPTDHTHDESHTIHTVEALATEETDTALRLAPDGTGGVEWAAGGGGGAPTGANYLVGTADAGLSAEIVVGTTPGGELGNTWASPTVDPSHSGSTHAATQAAAEATAATALSGHTTDASDAHDASAISVVDAGSYFAGTEVEAALQELAAGGIVGGPGSDWNAILTQAADQDVTDNITPQNSTNLSFTADANSMYRIEFECAHSQTNSTAKTRYRFQCSQAIPFDGRGAHGWLQDLSSAGAAGGNTVAVIGATGGGTQWPGADQTADLPSASDALDNMMVVWGEWFLTTGGSSTTVTYQFANATGGAGSTTRLHAGSTVRYRKIAG